MESLEVINKRLLDQYGRFEDGRPNWRVVWSDDQFEKHWVTHNADGIEFVNPVIEEVPKYNYAKHRYILERLIPVPKFVSSPLVENTSYEPVWTFEDNQGNALPPIWEAIYLLIKTVQANLETAGKPHAKYKMPEEMGNNPEAREYRTKKLYEQLFGNETPLGDALSLDSAVGYGIRKRNDWLN